MDFQRKAQLEKEETQAKLNQQNGYEEFTTKKESPKKASTTSGKRGQKSLDVKIEDYSENRSDSYESYEEPMIQKHQIAGGFNYYNGLISQDLTYRQVYTEASAFDMSCYNQGFYNLQSRMNHEFTPNNFSNLLNYLPQNMLVKQQSTESNGFGPTQEVQPLDYVKDEYVSYSEQETEHQPSTATNISPKSGSFVVQGRSVEDLSNDFRLDDCEVF
jgi:hypothetical protein